MLIFSETVFSFIPFGHQYAVLATHAKAGICTSGEGVLAAADRRKQTEIKRTRGASNRNTQRSAQVRGTLMFRARFYKFSGFFMIFEPQDQKG